MCRFAPRYSFSLSAALLITAFLLRGVALAGFDRASPRPGEVAQVSPPLVAVFADADLEPAAVNALQVQNQDLKRVDQGDGQVDPNNRRRLFVGLLNNVPAGRYVVSFVMTAALDSSTDRGQFAFYVIQQPTAEDRSLDGKLSLSSRQRPPTKPADNSATAELLAGGVAAAVVLAGGAWYAVSRRRDV